jgi:aspartyl/asparaginyl beta-hydroxylase (cupin superfamily)
MDFILLVFILLVLLVLIILKSISGYKLLHYINKFYAIFINEQEFYKTNHEWCKHLRDNYKKIRQEYKNYIKKYGKLRRFRDIDRVQTDYDISDIPWDVLFLRVYNKDTLKIKYFPKTYNLISKIPGCSLAMFSVLHPRKIIPPHTGPFKGVLRYHLALITPKKSNKCKIRVNKIEYYWQTGKDIIFDDTFIHSVENNTDETRVVLFLDIQRDFRNIFLNIINNVVLYFCKFNDSVSNIVDNTNNN